MKITVLNENTSKSDRFESEHGLSLYIETKKHNILFDCGQSDIFKRNATRLDVDLKNADIVIISHGHYDHTGGLQSFLEINKTAKVYLSEFSFGEHYSGSERYIGMDKSLKSHPRLIYTDDFCRIDDELSLCSLNEKITSESINSFGLNIKKNSKLFPDDFRHEQYLTINENGRKIVISGCSHKGINNIVSLLSPDVLVGGFHFSKVDLTNDDSKAFLNDAACRLNNTNCTFYTCHCTGIEQYKFLKSILKEKLSYIASGDVIII